MVDKVFLTDERRAILNGEADHLTDESLRTGKYRIRRRARTALSELVDVAESPEIDNTDIFEPEEIQELLLRLLLVGPQEGEGGGLVPMPGEDPDALEDGLPVVRYTDDYREYRRQLHIVLRGLAAPVEEV